MVSEPLGTWTRRVRWDEAGRLLAAWGEGAGAPAGTWAFAYDHNGERVLKYRIEEGQVAGATLFLRDEQGNVLSEMQWVDTGAAGYWARAKDHVYLGRDLIGSFDRSTGEPHVVSYARDHLGSQRAEVWGLDTSTATDLWPYGALARTKAAGAPPALANGAHLFTGHEREYTGSEALADQLMGLDYMHARYYSNTLGRFLSVDPVGGKPGLSQGWNRYAYVRGNPNKLVDSEGLQEVPTTVHPPSSLRHLLKHLPEPPTNLSPGTVWMEGGWRSPLAQALSSLPSIVDIGDRLSTFAELWDLAASRGRKGTVRDVRGSQEEAGAAFDRIVDDASVVDRSENGDVVLVGKDRKTGRTVIYPTRQSEKGVEATIEEQRVTPGGRKRKKEVRFRLPRGQQEDPQRPDEEN